MSAHTPGPWMVGGPFPSVSVCYVETPGDAETPPIWAPVCIVDQSTTGPQNAQALADARLIAAAPELLEALEALLNAGNGGPALTSKGVRDAARAAIAQARGGR